MLSMTMSGQMTVVPLSSLLLSHSPMQTCKHLRHSESCQDDWRANCRTIINYEEHIHPLWNLDRGASTCTACHTTATGTRIPDAQLDLTDGLSGDQADHYKAYRELLFDDKKQELVPSGFRT